ncbi:ATP-binding cassette domain-containing protein [Parvibaculum sp. MBR-TMA-1.3b-4.2]|jgi:putative ABC transport system ATP-binding protein
MAKEILAAQNLIKHFGSGDALVRAVDGVSLKVNKGDLVLIKGPSGSGKTTLLSMLGGLLKPTSGTVTLLDRELTGRNEGELASMRSSEIGFVFQAYNLLSAISVAENIVFPARLSGQSMEKAREQADHLISRLDLSHRRDARPDGLSGGEKQRVAVARALINDPPIILADEPTGNLDSQRGLEVAMLLQEIAKEDGRAVVIVTHDERIEDIADHILWLEDGRLRDRKAEPHEWARDPVCGMRVDRWVATSSVRYDDKEFVFCSERCREKFLAEPGTYLSVT